MILGTVVMALDEIIKSLHEQAVDKEALAGGDKDSVFTHDAQMLRAAAALLARAQQSVK